MLNIWGTSGDKTREVENHWARPVELYVAVLFHTSPFNSSKLKQLKDT